MTKNLCYEQSFQIINKSSDTNIEILTNLIKNLSSFADEIVRIHKDLLKVYENMPKNEKKVPVKKHLFKKSKNNYDSPEQQFQLIINLLIQRLIDPPLMIEFQHRLRSEFIDKMNEIKDDYFNTFQEIKNTSETSTLILRKSQESFVKIYSEYNQLCEQIDSIHSHITGDDNDSLKTQFESLKTQFFDKQKQLYDMLKEYNDSKGKYCIAMEENLTKWEMNDQKKDQAIIQLFITFSNVLPMLLIVLVE